ncbi:MAG TPA: CinA family protein [Gemmatimonadaceae bacterium]
MSQPFDPELIAQAADLLAVCNRHELLLATAESCTGGLLAAVLTEVPGCSSMFERGFVTYSNTAKEQMLGVPASLIEQHGAVSMEVARAMAEGALLHSQAHIAVAITGVAGPDGTEQKPVGLVHFAAAYKGGRILPATSRFGQIGRTEIRLASAREAIRLLQRLLAETDQAGRAAGP